MVIHQIVKQKMDLKTHNGKLRKIITISKELIFQYYFFNIERRNRILYIQDTKWFRFENSQDTKWKPDNGIITNIGTIFPRHRFGWRKMRQKCFSKPIISLQRSSVSIRIIFSLNSKWLRNGTWWTLYHFVLYLNIIFIKSIIFFNGILFIVMMILFSKLKWM